MAAAIDLADAGGLDAVSMRAVAERVGVTPMALYPHIGSKSALLEAMLTAVMRRLEVLPAGQAPWDERLFHLARSTRAATRSRPWAVMLLFARPSVEPSGALVVDAIYQALLDAGVPDAEVPRLARMVTTFVLGYGASESGGRFAGAEHDTRARRMQPDGVAPAHARLAPVLEGTPDWDEEFEADLADLREFLAAKAARHGPA